MKKETLEEVAEKYANKIWDFSDSNEKTLHNNCKKAFLKGAKWQAERMYSEEEVLEQLNLLHSMKNSLVDTFTDKNDYITMKWFKQFEKK
jgi:hypothetical protein